MKSRSQLKKEFLEELKDNLKMVNTQKTGAGKVDRELNDLYSGGFNPGDLVQRCDDGRTGKVVKVNGILLTTKKFKTITSITRKINGNKS